MFSFMLVDKVVAQLSFIQSGEAQTGHKKTFLYEKDGQTLEYSSWRGG